MRKTWFFVGAVVLLVLVACAGVGLWKYHEQPAFCGNTCHIMKPYVESWSNSKLLANAHGAAGVTCLQCHKSDIKQQVQEAVKYVKGDYQTPLEQRQFGTSAYCLQCHEHGSYAQVIELSKELEEQLGRNPHDSHNGELECNTCHKMHGPSTLFCSECHKVPTPGKGVWQ
jgi:hypothetical protein